MLKRRASKLKLQQPGTALNELELPETSSKNLEQAKINWNGVDPEKDSHTQTHTHTHTHTHTKRDIHSRVPRVKKDCPTKYNITNRCCQKVL